MRELVGKLETELPDCLPILGYGLFSRGPERPVAAKRDGDKSGLLLHALLSKVLLTFAIDFEKESDLSLAISANVMRVLNQEGMRLKDLAIMTGVSREAISVALGILWKKQIVVVETKPSGGPLKTVRLTPKGSEVQHAYGQLLGRIEEQWQRRFGKRDPHSSRVLRAA